MMEEMIFSGERGIKRKNALERIRNTDLLPFGSIIICGKVTGDKAELY